MTKSCPPQSTSEASREEQARNLCLRLLTARARTRAELAGQLKKRGYPDDVSTKVLDRLAKVGLVNDADFAEQWVHSRPGSAGKGNRALAAELRTKGLDDDVIEAALSGIDGAIEDDRIGRRLGRDEAGELSNEIVCLPRESLEVFPDFSAERRRGIGSATCYR